MSHPPFFELPPGRGRGVGPLGGPPPPHPPPQPAAPPPPDRGSVPVDVRVGRQFAEVSDLTKDPVYLSRDELEARCTEYYAFRFNKFSNDHDLEDDETAYASWDRAICTPVLDLSQRDMIKQIRRLDKECCVQNKKKTWTLALQGQLDKALQKLIQTEQDVANYQWVLAQLDQQLVRVPRNVAMKRTTIPIDKKTKSCCRSRKKHSSHKKRYWERISVTAYFKRIPRPERDINVLYNNRRNAQRMVYPDAAPGHAPPGPPPQPMRPPGPAVGGVVPPQGPPQGPPHGIIKMPDGKNGPPKGPNNKPQPKAKPGLKAPRPKNSSSSSSTGSDSSESTGTSRSSQSTCVDSFSDSSGHPRGRSRSRNRHWVLENSRFWGVEPPRRQHFKHEKHYIVDRVPFHEHHDHVIDVSPLAAAGPSASEIARIEDENYLAGRRDERDRVRAIEQLEREPRPRPPSHVRHVRGLEGRRPRGLLPYPDDGPLDFDNLSLNDSLDSGIEMPRGRAVNYRRLDGSPPRGGEPRPRYNSFSEDGDRFEMHHVPARHRAGHHTHDRDDHDHLWNRHVDIQHTHRHQVRAGDYSPHRDGPHRHPPRAPFDSGYRFPR